MATWLSLVQVNSFVVWELLSAATVSSRYIITCSVLLCIVVATYRVMSDKKHTDIMILLVDHLLLATIIINSEFLPS